MNIEYKVGLMNQLSSNRAFRGITVCTISFSEDRQADKRYPGSKIKNGSNCTIFSLLD